MTTEISVAGVAVVVVRKQVKNLHIGVYPPDGQVRVAAPLAVSDDAVRLAIIDKLGWIQRQRAGFLAQERQPPRSMVGGETHYFLGRAHRLRVVHSDGPTTITASRDALLLMKTGADSAQRERLLQEWYREQLRSRAVPLVEKWSAILDVAVAAVDVRRMQTRWGSCTTAARRVWLNLELAKKPLRCIEYVVVHELAHLIERKHNERFVALLDQHLPRWRTVRAELNAAPLAHESWPRSRSTPLSERGLRAQADGVLRLAVRTRVDDPGAGPGDRNRAVAASVDRIASGKLAGRDGAERIQLD